MIYTKVMKPRKGQFRFNGPPQITHTERPSGVIEVSATKFGRSAGFMDLEPPVTQRVVRPNQPETTRQARKVRIVGVQPKLQRKGIATAMWNYAKEQGFEPAHDAPKNQTHSGKQWAKKVGH